MELKALYIYILKPNEFWIVLRITNCISFNQIIPTILDMVIAEKNLSERKNARNEESYV